MNKIIFLGTGGARIVVFKQILHSGGIWLSINNTNLLLDPGPGCLIRCLEAKLKPTDLDGILLSHCHLDHSADINVMIEAMTEGGFKKKGAVFAPKDCLETDPVIFKYLRGYVEQITSLEEKGSYRIGTISFEVPVKHIHGNVQTYGFTFHAVPHEISYITDTRFFPELAHQYTGEILIINVVQHKPSQFDHLCADDVKRILTISRPKLVILTHFGMSMLQADPWKIAEELERETGGKVVIAKDGMIFDLEE